MQPGAITPPTFEPRCQATTIGSLPHKDVERGTRLMFASTPSIPSWVQFPRRAFHENMMVQFTEGLPGLVKDGDRVYFDTQAADYTEQLTLFYDRYLKVVEADDSDALAHFRISTEYAAGFDAFLRHLPSAVDSAIMLKGQVTGPFTQGINLLDENRRCAYYDETLRDVIVKTVALKAKWQLTQLGRFQKPLILFIDEPSLLGFGSQTFITVSEEDIIGDINEVVAWIHAHGALAGVHCEEDTDWSLLMATDLDILDFDAYDHLRAMTLYPDDLNEFFERGGVLGWGIVPTLDPGAASTETTETLLARFEAGLERFEKKGFERMALLSRALITPSCGAGGVLTEPLAERVLQILPEFSQTLRERYGLEAK
ncbi:MAG: hypothetical protein P8Z42_09090 [Anaerolineales bacterium]